MADENEADSPDESASAATPEGGQPSAGSADDAPDAQADDNALGSDALNEDALEPSDAAESATGSDGESDPHVAGRSDREPTLEELEQMLQGDDPADHDGADLDPDDEPAELADSDDSDRPSAPDDSNGDDTNDDDSNGDAELVSVGAAPSTRGGTAAAGADGETGTDLARTRKERQKKDRATPKQKKDVEKPKRTTPAGFVRESIGELRKVVYPTAPQLGNYFIVVLVFVLVIIGYVGLLDLGFGWVIVKVFG